MCCAAQGAHGAWFLAEKLVDLCQQSLVSCRSASATTMCTHHAEDLLSRLVRYPLNWAVVMIVAIRKLHWCFVDCEHACNSLGRVLLRLFPRVVAPFTFALTSE